MSDDSSAKDDAQVVNLQSREDVDWLRAARDDEEEATKEESGGNTDADHHD